MGRTSKPEDLLAEAREILDELEKYAQAGAWTLAEEAYLAEAFQRARCSREEAEDLLDELLRDPKAHEIAFGFVNRARHGIAEGRYPRPPHRLLAEAFAPSEAYLAELLDLGATPLLAIAAASIWVARETPEAFGEVQDADELQERIARQRHRFEDINVELLDRWQETSELGEVDETSSTARLVWKKSPIAIFPRANSVRRLLDWQRAKEVSPPTKVEPVVVETGKARTWPWYKAIEV